LFPKNCYCSDGFGKISSVREQGLIAERTTPYRPTRKTNHLLSRCTAKLKVRGSKFFTKMGKYWIGKGPHGNSEVKSARRRRAEQQRREALIVKAEVSEKVTKFIRSLRIRSAPSAMVVDRVDIEKVLAYRKKRKMGSLLLRTMVCGDLGEKSETPNLGKGPSTKKCLIEFRTAAGVGWAQKRQVRYVIVTVKSYPGVHVNRNAFLKGTLIFN